MTCLQVAALQRADLSKSNHQSLATALCEVSENLMKAKENANSQDDIQEALKASGLDSVQGWLLSVGESLVSTIKDKHEVLCKSVRLSKADIDSFIDKVPSVGNEALYRQETLKFLQPLAKQVAALETGLKELAAQEGIQKKLHQLKFGENEQLTFPETEVSASGLVPAAGRVAAIASFHVSAVAALCLLRSDELSKSSQVAHKTMQNLKDVLATLQSKLKKVPVEETELQAFGQGITDELGRFTAKPKKPAEEEEQGEAEGKKAKAAQNKEKKKEKSKAEKTKDAKKDKKKHKEKDKKKDKKEKKQKKRAREEEEEEEEAEDHEEGEEEEEEADDEVLDEEESVASARKKSAAPKPKPTPPAKKPKAPKAASKAKPKSKPKPAAQKGKKGKK